MLYMDFSRVTGNIDELPRKFNSYCCGRLDDFIDTYRDDYPEDGVKKVLESKDFVEKINFVNNMAMKYRIPLYLFIEIGRAHV